jgi:hypothetical protein
LNKRDLAAFVLGSLEYELLDYDWQLHAIRNLLRRHRFADEKLTKEIAEAEAFARTCDGDNEREVDEWIERLHYSSASADSWDSRSGDTFDRADLSRGRGARAMIPVRFIESIIVFPRCFLRRVLRSSCSRMRPNVPRKHMSSKRLVISAHDAQLAFGKNQSPPFGSKPKSIICSSVKGPM